MNDDNFLWDIKIEQIELTPKQQDKLMHRQWLRTIKRLQNQLRRKKSAFLRQREIVSNLKKFLRYKENCVHIYTTPKERGATGSLVFRCNLDDKLCKFQCGVLEPKNRRVNGNQKNTLCR